MIEDDLVKNYKGFTPRFPKGKEWFSPEEVSKMLGASGQFVRRCVYSGRLFAHVSSSGPLNEDCVKSYIRIHKSAILIFLLESANYNAADFLDKMELILSYRSDFDKMALLEMLKKITA